MKKTILIVAATLATVVASAQTKMWIGGTAGFSTQTKGALLSTADDAKTTGGTFGPQFGYWVNDNIAVGLGLSYSSSDTKTGSASDKTTGFAVKPFARYYKKMDKFALYGELSVGIGSGKHTTNTGVSGASDVSNDSKSMNVNLGPGVQYWFTDNWSMNTSIGLLGYRSNTDVKGASDASGNQVDRTDSGIVFGLDMTTLNFGLNYHF